MLELLYLCIVPVEVFRGTDGDDGVGVGQGSKDTDSVVHKVVSLVPGVGGLDESDGGAVLLIGILELCANSHIWEVEKNRPCDRGGQ